MEVQGAVTQATAGQQSAVPEVGFVSAPAPQATQAGSPAADHTQKGPLTSAIARLFGCPDASQSHTVSVSYRVVKQLDEIVTVFSDPVTGQEITQFPSELLIQMAVFFDKQNGVTVDQNA
ncbi:MAG: hypothetical protein ACXWNZ_08440 [Vulcanimicrobiaceae bacterium]